MTSSQGFVSSPHCNLTSSQGFVSSPHCNLTKIIFNVLLRNYILWYMFSSGLQRQSSPSFRELEHTQQSLPPFCNELLLKSQDALREDDHPSCSVCDVGPRGHCIRSEPSFEALFPTAGHPGGFGGTKICLCRDCVGTGGN